jgi:hypothetical protein
MNVYMSVVDRQRLASTPGLGRAFARAVAPILVCLGGAASADTFGGFSGVDRPYVVNQDRVCVPLKVVDGRASGAPSCQKAAADVLARLSIKPPALQSGVKATVVAAISGRTLTVSRKSGEPLVVWEALDALGKVTEVYTSQYDDRIAVVYSARRLGKESTEVIAFDLLKAGAQPPAQPAPPPVQPAPPAAVEDPKLTKALADARKLSGAKAIAAWKAVLVLDAQSSEARFRLAAASAATKQLAEAQAQLDQLAASSRPDAVEWLFEARFDPAFAAMRSDAKFRTAVRLDRKPTSLYERLMVFGGGWEQTGTSCDKPDVKLKFARDRTFKLAVKTSCQGQVYDTPFKGTWRFEGNAVVLVLPTNGKATADDEAGCAFEQQGDEDALHCNVGKDIEFAVLPARR